MSLYPLKFRPRFVEKMWGGRKIETVLGKPLPPGKQIGESWELFDFPPGVVDASSEWISSEIINGPLAGRTLHALVGEFGSALTGSAALAGTLGQFPILIKFLDAREDLSVQVHPDEEFAASNPAHTSNLKRGTFWNMTRERASSRAWHPEVRGNRSRRPSMPAALRTISRRSRLRPVTVSTFPVERFMRDRRRNACG